MNSRPRRTLPPLVAAACFLALLPGCRTRITWQEPVPITRTVTSCRQAEPVNLVDVLFMVDNSTSMDAMQNELRARFPEFLRVFRDLATQGTYVDLHLGVVTSDYGAGRSGSGNCEPSPGGQRGKLQPIGQLAQSHCKPPVGANYVHYEFSADGHGASNLPPGQGLEDTFTCMASVGARGCGFEHPLESVYAALHDGMPENRGFLRPGALLVVLFLTNEDDCSAPADSDLFDPNLFSRYGYNGGAGYRCTRYGVMCGAPPAAPPYGSSGGPLTLCAPAPNPNGAGPGKLFDVSRYIDFFTRPAALGGVSLSGEDVMLVGIAAPDGPFETILANPGTGQGGKPYAECPMLSDVGNPICEPTLQHSCFNPFATEFYGDPAVRLNTVIRAAAHSVVSSICDRSYSLALLNVGQLIGSQLGQCCLPAALPTNPQPAVGDSAYVADCTVTEVTGNPDGSNSSVEVPRCVAGGALPCWRIAPRAQCAGLSPQGIGVTVDRGGLPSPAHARTHVSCVSVP